MPELNSITTRRWFRFSLRTLLVATALACLFMGWVVKERRQSAIEAEIDWKLVSQGGTVQFAHRFEIPHERVQPWWRRMAMFTLGDRVDSVFLDGTPINALDSLSQLHSLGMIDASGCCLSDLTPLAMLQNLALVKFDKCPIEDLSPLSKQENLVVIYARNTQVKSLEPLKAVTRLYVLHIEGSPVADLSPLHGLKRLSILDVRRTLVSKEQIEALKAKLPDCDIRHDFSQ